MFIVMDTVCEKAVVCLSVRAASRSTSEAFAIGWFVTCQSKKDIVNHKRPADAQLITTTVVSNLPGQVTTTVMLFLLRILNAVRH
jgi:hypothetical protein